MICMIRWRHNSTMGTNIVPRMPHKCKKGIRPVIEKSNICFIILNCQPSRVVIYVCLNCVGLHSRHMSIWDLVPTAATCEQMQDSQKENFQTKFQRVPGSPSHIKLRHMPYQYCSAALIEANASYLVSIWDVVRAGATCEQMQKSQKQDFQTNFQRVPGSPSQINPQHMHYQYCSAAPIEANASYVVSIWDVVRAGATCEQMQNWQK